MYYTYLFEMFSKLFCNANIRDNESTESYSPKNGSNYLDSAFRDVESCKTNCRLTFLILLRDEDFEKCIVSVRDIIKLRKNKFPGKLILERFSDVDDLPYIIERPPLPRTIYVMLPKEKLFVPLSNFTSRYIESKIQELQTIFSSLKAKTIKIKRIFKTTKRQYINSKLSIYDFQSTHGNINFTNENYEDIVINSEMTFGNSDEKVIVDDMPQKYYYLNREYEWQNIINRRLNERMIIDKYTYTNTEQKLFSTKFLNSLKFMKIAVDYDWKSFRNFIIQYEIEYYPL